MEPEEPLLMERITATITYEVDNEADYNVAAVLAINDSCSHRLISFSPNNIGHHNSLLQ